MKVRNLLALNDKSFPIHYVPITHSEFVQSIYYHQTVILISSGTHDESSYQCTVSAAIYWPKPMLLKLIMASVLTLPSNDQSKSLKRRVVSHVHVARLLKLIVWPYPADGEIVQLDMLNDLIQQPVCHGVEICKSVGLQKGNGREKQRSQRSSSRLRALSENVTVRVINLIPIAVIYKCTWFLSDMRKSSLDPGSPNSIKVFTSRRSALFPGSKEEIIHMVSGSALMKSVH